MISSLCFVPINKVSKLPIKFELSNAEYNSLFGGDAGGSLAPPPLLNAPDPAESVWIPQGGASQVALAGTEQLAQEIFEV